MKIKNTYLIEGAVFLLVILWVYTASSKLLDFHHFKAQMHNQTIPRPVADILIYVLPEVEIIAAVLLIYHRTREAGFYLSAVLMMLFTTYIGLVLLNYFSRIPCSCGGVIGTMTWQSHFVFNLFFLLLTIYGIFHIHRERRRTQIF